MFRHQAPVVGTHEVRLGPATLVVGGAPRPGVPEPQGRQQVQPSRFGGAVSDRQANQDIVGGCLRVLRRHVPIAVSVEHSGVGKLVLRFVAAAAAVLLAEPFVGKLGLRVLVEGLEVRVGGRGVEVEVNFFDILGVVALRVGEAEQALLEVWVLAVPQG